MIGILILRPLKGGGLLIMGLLVIVTAGDDMVITLRSVPNVPVLQSGGESRFRV